MKLLKRVVRLDDGPQAFDDEIEVNTRNGDVRFVFGRTRVDPVPHTSEAGDN